MYAVVKDGGRQLTVREGDRVLLDRKAGLAEGAEVRLDQVLLVGGGEAGSKIGTPTVQGAAVVGKVLGEVKGDKLVVFKKRKRKNSKVKNGHRQKRTAVRIEKIEA